MIKTSSVKPGRSSCNRSKHKNLNHGPAGKTGNRLIDLIQK